MFNKKFINLAVIISLILGISFFNFEANAQSKKDVKKAEKIAKDGSGSVQ